MWRRNVLSIARSCNTSDLQEMVVHVARPPEEEEQADAHRRAATVAAHVLRDGECKDTREC